MKMFLVVAWFFSSASETKPDYYNQKVNGGVVLRVAEQRKTPDSLNSGNLKKYLKVGL